MLIKVYTLVFTQCPAEQVYTAVPQQLQDLVTNILRAVNVKVGKIKRSCHKILNKYSRANIAH